MNRSKNRSANGRFAAVGALALLLVLAPALSIAETMSILSAPDASAIIAVRNATVREDVVSGELLNLSPRPMQNVELLIRQIWHWSNEYRPGPNPPGAADYFVVPAEIPSGAAKPFTFRLPSRLSDRANGYIEFVVTVAAFSETQPGQQESINAVEGKPVS